METNEAWAAEFRRARRLGDFRKCPDHGEYQLALGCGMRDLKGESKMAEESRRDMKG